MKDSFLYLLIFSFIGLFLISEALRGKDDVPFWVAKGRGCTSEECFKGVIRAATSSGGASLGVGVLKVLYEKGIIEAKADSHFLVHQVGYAIAENEGVTVDAFLSCPSDFNYGCQHGFFEYALAQVKSYKDTATSICENIPKNASPKLYAYCYHGVGHGLMMAVSYKIDKALDVCNLLPNVSAVESCWQGVFMEGGNAAIDGAEIAGFSRGDPLSPCSKVDSRYKRQCYINHAGWLLEVTGGDLERAARICLSAKDGGESPCLQSLGLVSVNPIWHRSILGVDTSLDRRKNAEIAWGLCRTMPQEAWEDCVVGAVADIHNFDQDDTERSLYFCNLVGSSLRKTCFGEIGKNLALQVASVDRLRLLCKVFGERRGFDCLVGAGGVNKGVFEELSLSEEEQEKLLGDNSFLRETIGKFGPARVIAEMAVVMPERTLSCHTRAHLTGRYTYELFGAKAFKLCTSECHSGCYHGATEAFFREHGTSGLEKNLELVCQGEINKFYRHQCVHGVGHGLMAWSSYELFVAIDACGKLTLEKDRSSCRTGVFMENVVGGLAGGEGHLSRYLSADPQYPCNIVPDEYKGECYYLQTSRMVELFGGDFSKVAKECLKVQQAYQLFCFQSMGRDASGVVRQDVDLAIASCMKAPAGLPRRECFGGAAQDVFWDQSGRDKAIRFCLLLEDADEARRCWEIVSERASQILASSDYWGFCAKIPSSLGFACPEPSVTGVASSEVGSGSSGGIPESVGEARVGGEVRVVMGEGGYGSKRLVVKRGTKVIFENKSTVLRWPASNIHPTHGIYPEFDPGRPLSEGESWSFVFGKVGVWYFHDHISPSITGTVEVVD